MRRMKTLSVIAASLLTATVVFTGCGGGGSSVSAGAGGSVSTSSSTSSITPKQVVVADGYVLNATVKSGTETAINVAAGKYEFADASKVKSDIVSQGGINDINENGQADAQEPTAPTLKAPASYSHVTPMTTLIGENGLTEQDIINYFNTQYGLNLTTLDFDPVQAPVEVKAEVVALGYILTHIQQTASARVGALPFDDSGDTSTGDSSSTQSSTSSNGTTSSDTENSSSSCVTIPGVPCSSTGTSSTSSSTESSASSGASLTMATVANAIKSGLRLEDVLPGEYKAVVEAIKSNVKSGNLDEVICNFATNSAVCGTSSSSENTEESSSTSSSSSSESSTSSTTSSSSSGGVGALPFD